MSHPDAPALLSDTTGRTSGTSLVAAVVLGMVVCCSAAAAPATTIRLAFVGAAESDAHRGARQGLAEANAQGRFLSLGYELLLADDASAAVARDPIAIVAAVSPTRLLRLAADAPGIAVLNASAPDDELREECVTNLFHTIASRRMAEDALQQWLRKHPQSNADARVWHEDFEKYAAAQLNKRYRDTFARAMSDEAWAGWAAVKLVSDVVARDPALGAGALVEQLKTDLDFDGQKGAGLSFRETGQLRQPMLLVEDGRLVGEAPVRGVVDTGNLDSLGLAQCHK